MTIFRLLVGVVFAGIMAICGVLSTLIQWEVMEKVNALLPESERFQPLFWGPAKKHRLAKEYRRLFPDGKDFRRINRLFAIALIALVFLAICILL